MAREVGLAESAMVRTMSDRRMSLGEELRATIRANTELQKSLGQLENRMARELRASARKLAEAREEVAELRAALVVARDAVAAQRGAA